MRKFVLLLAMVSAIALAGYLPLGASVKSGPIVVSSVGDSVYVIVTPDDGNVAMYDISDINEAAHANWTKTINNVGDDGIPSTGGHAEGELSDGTKLNVVAVAVRGVGLELIGFDESVATKVDAPSANTDWKNVFGGIAVFKAAEPDTSKIYFGVVGVSANGRLLAHIFSYDGNNFISIDSADDNIGENAYSTVAVRIITEYSEAKVYVGTDHGFYVYTMTWSGSSGSLNLTRSKRFDVPGPIQSGIALDEDHAYFLSYNLDKVYLNIYPDDGNVVISKEIPLEDGVAPNVYPTNSPVVVKNGTGSRVFVAVGKAIYYLDTNEDSLKVEKWADVGEPIYAAPVVLDDKSNPLNYILAVVTANGNVYRVENGDGGVGAQLISNKCAGHGSVYSPPVARSGKLVFGVSEYGGGGGLCSVDISNISIGTSTKEPWPAFGYADGRTQVYNYNPPFKIPIFLEAYIQNGDPVKNYFTDVAATYTTSDMSSTDTAYFNSVINVPNNGEATVVALNYSTGLCDDISGDDASLVFKKWIDDYVNDDIFDSDFEAASPVRHATPITTFMIYSAKYNLYYKVYTKVIDVNDPSGSLDTTTEWATAFENITLNAATKYVLDHWKAYACKDNSLTLIASSTDDDFTLNNVDSPILVKEFVKRVYGTVEFKYQKWLMEPSTPPSNRFTVLLKVTRLSTHDAGDASSVQGFGLKIDLSKLNFEASLVDATYNINISNSTVYPTDTSERAFYPIASEGDNKAEFLLFFATPIEQATDVFTATLTFQYSGEGFPMNGDDVFKADLVSFNVGGEDLGIGIGKILTSKILSITYPSSSDTYIPEFLGYTSKLGDFDNNGVVDIFDFMALADHYGLTDQDPDWNPIYDIGPRDNASLPSFPGYLRPETPRKIDFKDLLIEAVMYGH